MNGDNFDKEDCRSFKQEIKADLKIAHKRIDKMFYWMLAAIILVAFDIALKVHEIGKKVEIRYIRMEDAKDVPKSN